MSLILDVLSSYIQGPVGQAGPSGARGDGGPPVSLETYLILSISPIKNIAYSKT